MKGFAIGATVMVAAGIVVLFLAQLRWDRVETKDSGVIYRLCDLVVPKVPAEGVEVYAYSEVMSDPAASPTSLTMVIRFHRPMTVDLETGDVTGGISAVYLDPTTGRVVREYIQPEEKALFRAILARARVDTDPPAFWPYGTATQAEPDRLAEYAMARSPDPGSGLATFAGGSFGGGRWETIANCRSLLQMGTRPGSSEVVRLAGSVQSEDEAAFDAWASTVRP